MNFWTNINYKLLLIVVVVLLGLVIQSCQL